MSNIIQNSVFPTFSLCSQIDLYFRHNEFVDLDMANSNLKIKRKGRVTTDTYFNSLSIGKWKRHTNISSLHFSITFKGSIKLVWRLRRLHFSDRILDEQYLTNEQLSTSSIPLKFWSTLEDGMLSFDIEAISSSEISSFNYSTNIDTLNRVKLGIVITHFNRQNFVLPAVERLNSQLLAKDEFKDKVSLYIVDNSQNLPHIENVTIIPNENLGGAGGFTRGLMNLKEQGSYTHCLFMDDDASCEVEGIKRTLALLEFAKDRNTAIAGAMLREAEMFRQFENGARFDGVCRPNKGNFDLRDINQLLINELEEQIDYGGWWFFAFPIENINHYAFPYFVRGDDSGFSLLHKFHIITLNGISSWQEDFTLKNGPLPHYLDSRYHLMHQFHGLVRGSKFDILKTTARMALKNLFAYQYETAEAAIQAMEDVSKGPEFWENNVNMLQKRPEIQKLVSNEKVVDIPLNVASQAVQGDAREGKVGRFFRLLTLNGHLIPNAFFKSGTVWQNKGFGGNLIETFRYKRVLYIHWPTYKGYIVEENKSEFFRLFKRYLKATYTLYKNYDSLKNEYTNSYDKLTSASFWKKQFKQDQ
ncbi:glycosyltransferase [Mannheimia indoligenes]|uniref:glycosyltransferase n=1 Tax=Mannheimia indoligenes TaxID=3103145 RepID=UPI002FE6BC6A